MLATRPKMILKKSTAVCIRHISDNLISKIQSPITQINL